MAGADSYLSAQVLTASPYRLHLMVVEGAVQFASLGARSLAENDRESAHLALSRSRDFVTELIGGLNEEYDPLLAARMKQLFFAAYIHLAEGERDRDATRVHAALAILKSHHATWIELGERLKTGAANEPSPAKPAGEARAWSA
jgi:flagellar protein FliS